MKRLKRNSSHVLAGIGLRCLYLIDKFTNLIMTGISLKKLLLLIHVMCMTLMLHAQNNKQYAFTHYTVNNGLAAYNITSIIQDKEGYMWIASINGLQRFDGFRFLTFKHNPNDPQSIPDNFIAQLLLDKEQHLWMFFSNGDVGIFDTHKMTFKKAKLKLKNERNLKRSRYLMVDADGHVIFVFGNAEVVTYNKTNNEFGSVYNTFNAPENWQVTNIIDDAAAKKYWLFCDSGIVAYNKQTRNLSYRNHNAEHEPVIDALGQVKSTAGYILDNQQRLWFLSWPPTGGCSIYCYNLASREIILNAYVLTMLAGVYNEPAILKQQRNGAIWLCGLNVFAQFNEKTKKFELIDNDSKSGLGVNYESANLFEDREGNLWVCTSNSGLYVFNPSWQLFKSVDHLNIYRKDKGNGSVMSFMELKNGDVIVSAWGDGTNRYDSNFNNIPLKINGLPEANGLTTWGMCRLKDNATICMVGQPAFVAFYNELTGTFKKYEPSIFERVTIRQVLQDNDGRLWIGSHIRGIYKWDSAKAIHSFEDGFYKLKNIPNVKVLKLVKDRQGFIWAGTETDGVYKINPSTDAIVEHLTEKGPPGKRILGGAAALLEYDDSLLLIGGNGIQIYNRKTNLIENITAANGLPSDMVVSLEKDHDGYVWIGMMTGLCRMNLKQRSYIFYDRNDGMTNDYFDASVSYKLNNGKLLFGTTTNFVVFNPTEINIEKKQSEVHITDFKIANYLLSVDSLLKLDEITLSYTQNSVSIGFSNLSYFSRQKLMYYYMLEGIDNEWKQSNELNLAVYNYLPPGHYTFKVKTVDQDLNGNDETAILKITITPPFWKSWWFILLVIIVFSVLVFLFDRLQQRKKQGLQHIRSEIANNLHSDINVALNNINILSEMARIKADHEPEKTKEYLEQIHSKSHNMIIAMDDMLWSINPDNDNMQKTADRMREYIDALKNRYGGEIDMTIDKKVEQLTLDMKLRHDALILFKEWIKGLVMAGTKKCFIHIGLERNHLIFTLQLENSGCDMQQLNNLFHRSDLEKHMNRMGAKLGVEVHKTNSVISLDILL